MLGDPSLALSISQPPLWIQFALFGAIAKASVHAVDIQYSVFQYSTFNLHFFATVCVIRAFAVGRVKNYNNEALHSAAAHDSKLQNCACYFKHQTCSCSTYFFSSKKASCFEQRRVGP